VGGRKKLNQKRPGGAPECGKRKNVDLGSRGKVVKAAPSCCYPMGKLTKTGQFNTSRLGNGR